MTQLIFYRLEKQDDQRLDGSPNYPSVARFRLKRTSKSHSTNGKLDNEVGQMMRDDRGHGHGGIHMGGWQCKGWER